MMTDKHSIFYGVLDALDGLPFFLTAPLYRPWHLRWGATDIEVQGQMAGDEIVPNSSFNATRAITIAAPIERVWPWIVQMGYRRAVSILMICSTTLATPVQTGSLRSFSSPRSAIGCR